MNKNLFAGMSRQELGIVQVYNNNKAFVDQMRVLAKEFERANGAVTVDELRFYADEQGIAPGSPNAWGAIFKEPGWCSQGHVRSEYQTNHARWIQRWSYYGA